MLHKLPPLALPAAELLAPPATTGASRLRSASMHPVWNLLTAAKPVQTRRLSAGLGGALTHLPPSCCPRCGPTWSWLACFTRWRACLRRPRRRGSSSCSQQHWLAWLGTALGAGVTASVLLGHYCQASALMAAAASRVNWTIRLGGASSQMLDGQVVAGCLTTCNIISNMP